VFSSLPVVQQGLIVVHPSASFVRSSCGTNAQQPPLCFDTSGRIGEVLGETMIEPLGSHGVSHTFFLFSEFLFPTVSLRLAILGLGDTSLVFRLVDVK
jgi:hypothetical protein